MEAALPCGAEALPSGSFRSLPTTGSEGGHGSPTAETVSGLSAGHLWLAGIRSGVRQAVTDGISSESQSQPALSPDGKQLLFMQSRTDYMIVSASLSDATVERVISSEVPTGMPAWALHRKRLSMRASEADRLRSGCAAKTGTARLSPRSLSRRGRRFVLLPALSPQADRLLYTRGSGGSNDQFNWISSVSGGPRSG